MTDNTNPTQCERVLAYMKQFGPITQLEALNNLGVLRLAARVKELRDDGHPIQGNTVKVLNRFNEWCSVKEYRLETAEA